MVEALIFFALGFLIAGLLALLIFPAVHARAVRLTKRRMEAITPVSIAEIQADKDHLRAEFAVSARQIELNLEQVKTRAAEQLAELGRKTEMVGRLQAEVETKTARLTELEVSEKSLQMQLLSGSEELMQKLNLTGELEKKLAEKEAEAAKLGSELAEVNGTRDSLRVELVALQTQLETTRDRVRQLETASAEKELTIGERSTVVEAATHALTEIKRERDALQAELDAARERERQMQAERAQAAEAVAATPGAEAGAMPTPAVDETLERERAEAAELRRRIAEIDAMAPAVAEMMSERDALKSERDALQSELDAARDRERQLQSERDALADEKSAAPIQVDKDRERERAENAELRERIAEVAAEVARLTMELEGDASPIPALIAAENRPTIVANGSGDAPTLAPGANEPAVISLADRIRALRDKASRGVASKQAGVA